MSKDAARRQKIQNNGDELPVTLRALRERAGLGESDGVEIDLREFFAESKFSGDPTRETAVAMVALDSVLRDPTFLDATTCFGEGQIDTAVGAAVLILGEKNVNTITGVSGENDLLQLAGYCQTLSKDRDIKAGCMAARHLWGLCNTALRAFPTAVFRNGSYDGFQAALLAAASRHLGSFNPETSNIDKDLRELASKAEKVAELGGEGRWHKEPTTDKQIAETIIFLAKQGKFTELRDSSLIDVNKTSGEPSAKVAKLLGLRKSKSSSKGRGADENWTTTTDLSGNGAFFAGRTYEEVKARYPGYPGHSSESSYWDACARHPATHGICSRLFSKVPLLTKVGGVEEGLSRAVTNKMVHHNTKFSRLSLWVKLSNGKGFWVHRTRPINWASHGVTNPPLAEQGQMDLFNQPTRVPKRGKGGQGEVQVVGFELKAMNYSHMPWVNKAISQYVEEAPFISTPSDEHQACLAVLSKSLREGGVQYRESVEKAAELYSLLPGRGTGAAKALGKFVEAQHRRRPEAEEYEALIASSLRTGGGVPAGESEAEKKASNIVSEALSTGLKFLESLGVSPTEAKEMVGAVAGAFPAKIEVDSDELAKVLNQCAGASKILSQDTSRLGKLVTGLATRSISEAAALTDLEEVEIAKSVGKVIGTGVVKRDDIGTDQGGDQSEALGDFMRIAGEVLDKRGLSGEAGRRACLEVIADAVDISPEVEIGLAKSGATLGDKEREIIFSYCAKHAAGKPLSGQDLHNRMATFGGGLTISLDAPVGEEGKDDLYSVFSATDTHDPEEEAFGDNETPHWLDQESGRGADSGRPGFMPDGGDELFMSFGVESMAEDLYRVVSSKGDESQKTLLEEFASFDLESIGSRGGPTVAKDQVSAMLDLLDREDILPKDDAATRRRALAWVFHSVMNSVGFDDQGFCRMGGTVNDLREALHSKIKRHGMPGILILAGEPVAGSQLSAELDNMNEWGYRRIGVPLDDGCAVPLEDWCKRGSARSLVEGISKLREKDDAVLALKKISSSGVGTAALSLLSGKADRDSEASSYLESNPLASDRIMECLAEESPKLYSKLMIFSEAQKRGMQIDCLGTRGPEAAADAARLDSVLFVDKRDARQIASRLGEFGVDAVVTEDGISNVIKGHPDYASEPAKNAADRMRCLKSSRVPLPKKLVLAALVSHDTEVK